VSSLLYIVVALAIAGVVITVLWYRDRRESSLEDGIEEFHRELEALSPESGTALRRPRNRPGGRPG
jgi:FtsZ-interacting cell division protein ZipA